MVVDVPRRDGRRLGDVADRRGAVALVREEVEGGIEDVRPAALIVLPGSWLADPRRP
jgi:hypothetical protein